MDVPILKDPNMEAGKENPELSFVDLLKEKRFICQIGIRLFKSTQFLVNTRLHPEGEVIPKRMFIFA
jgi:hypothetical protein